MYFNPAFYILYILFHTLPVIYFAQRVSYLRLAMRHHSCNLHLGKTHLLGERPSPCVINLQSDNKICRFYLSRRNAQNTHITWKCSLAYLCKYFCPNINIFSCLSIMFVQSTFLCPLHWLFNFIICIVDDNHCDSGKVLWVNIKW